MCITSQEGRGSQKTKSDSQRAVGVPGKLYSSSLPAYKLNCVFKFGFQQNMHVGAIIFARQGAILQGDIVKDSLIHWPSTNGGEDDYHGNFDSILFE
jgi:hypothetical protein